jgi:isopenicillin N synthase-like dioxygenase
MPAIRTGSKGEKMAQTREAVTSIAEGAADEVIPVLDLGDYLAGVDGAATRLAGELCEAQERIGFFYIRNHGVPQDLIDAMFAETARFHALPAEPKLSLRIDAQQTGYAPIRTSEVRNGEAVVDTRHKPDLSAAFWVRRDRPDDDPEVLAGRRFRVNKWPADLPGFRDTVTRYMQRMEQLGASLLPLYARALGLPDDAFAGHFDRADTVCRFGHYPAHLGGPDEFGASPHVDAGFLTLLPQAAVAGLEVLTRSGRWIAAPIRPGEMLVNGGNCLKRFTNGRFLATPHRVLGGLPRDRYSMPLFFNPNFDAIVAPLPTCVREERPAKFTPISYEEYIIDYLASVYAHQAEAQRIIAQGTTAPRVTA